MTEIRENAIAFLQRRYPRAPVQNNEVALAEENGNILFKVWPMIAHDWDSGIMQRALVVKDLGARGEHQEIISLMDKMFEELRSSAHVKYCASPDPTSHDIDTNQMTYSPRIILYTNNLVAQKYSFLELASQANMLIDIVDESKMHKTVFISYGGTDEDEAMSINETLSAKGVKTWFFPIDAEPGAKLHRVMHDGVNNHDRVLLLCSKNSLTRPGVLNEIERVLEREAREGGKDILIPVTLDNFVYGDWAPNRADIASQIRSRVITKIDVKASTFDTTIEKVVEVLRK